ncbi:hypothetical protein EI555_013374 [Monodon monoceros]|uniref:Uncharacterized protein n=1 Tax=Monodon monoceros TaxID=40151 RepID=A0A4U1FAW6_MONMO|nr:hypothetical protein EI555_013374 [Monodon monoceros]
MIWQSNHLQAFMGSVLEGQVCILKRKIQQNYKKLLWRVKKAQTTQESQFTDWYPDHLKHLYLDEEERLNNQLRKVDQSLLEQVDWPLSEEQVNQPLSEEQCNIDQALSEEHCSNEQPQPEIMKNMNRYKLSVLLRNKNLRVENKREKKLKGSTIRRKSVQNIEQKDYKRPTKLEFTNGVPS